MSPQVADNPSNYGAHIQLISALRSMDEMELPLREAREHMASIFPLPEGAVNLQHAYYIYGMVLMLQPQLDYRGVAAVA